MKKVLVSILIFSCSILLFSNNFKNQKLPEPSQIAMKIIDDTAKSLGSKYEMIPCGNGMDMDAQFDYLEISFRVFRPLEMDQARNMLFDCIDIFLKKINSDKSLNPYLQNYPFILKNVGIVFYISEKGYGDLFHPNICVARCSASGVYFWTNDPENEYQYKETYEETHEEALALVKKYRAEHPQ